MCMVSMCFNIRGSEDFVWGCFFLALFQLSSMARKTLGGKMEAFWKVMIVGFLSLRAWGAKLHAWDGSN